jgi:uncharacterized protein
MKISGATALLLAGCLTALGLFATPALAGDAPAKAQGTADRASMQTMQIPSHGELLNALVYVAEGPGPHPVVILLHGFPGNERNLDLAQDMRRAGWDVVYFNYRGSWGTPGDFSFAHCIEDVASVIAYLRKPGNAAKLRLDPAKIVLVGHSMGGFMATQGAAADPAVKGIALISGADMAGMFQQVRAKEPSAASAVKKVGASLAEEGLAPLRGVTPDGLAQELADHASIWVFPSTAAALKGRPVFVISSDDGLAPLAGAYVDALKKAGDSQVTTLHLPTDHSYSDQRTELSQALLKWLATVK